MKKVKMIFLSSIVMYKDSLNAKSESSTEQKTSKTHDNKTKSISTSTTQSNIDALSEVSDDSPYSQEEAASTSNSNSISFHTAHSTASSSRSLETANESSIQQKTSKIDHTTKSISPFTTQSREEPATYLNFSQLSSKDFQRYVQSQMDTSKIHILEHLNQSCESSSNIYENFMLNMQKTKLYSIAKKFNINIEEHIKNIPNTAFQIDFATELKTYEEILNSMLELVEQNLSDVANFANIHSQLDESIKTLQETINTIDKKDITIINLINSIIELLQNLKKNTVSFSDSIKDDLDKIRVCYKIDFFNNLLSNTKDDFKEDILNEHIREIWEKYRFKYFEQNPNHKDLLSKKSNKSILIKDFNNVPIDFQEDLNAMINYAKNTTEKMDATVSLIQPLSNLVNLADALLSNTISLDFLTKLQDSFENMNNVVQKIKINNTLPNITSSINNLYTTLNDALTFLLIETVKKAESINNKNNPGFFKTFKRTFMPITLSGLASLRNVLMFNHFKIHSNDFVDKYSLSAHDWYSSNYRIHSILNTMSTDNKNSIVKALELQKSIILKLIETFNHNYQSKNSLTKKDYKHIKKLISQLQIIMNILTSLKAPSETTSSSLKTLEDLKFNLHSVSEDLNYIKRNSYQPNELFFISKKTKESESIKILTSETNNEQLRYLTKILYEFFNNGKKLTKVSEEDSKDLKDKNLFDLRTNHTEFLNKN